MTAIQQSKDNDTTWIIFKILTVAPILAIVLFLTLHSNPAITIATGLAMAFIALFTYAFLFGFGEDSR